MKLILTILIGVSCAFGSLAQEKTTTNNNDIWFLIHGNYEVSDKMGFDSEAHFRLADYGNQKQQILLRPSIYYNLNERVKFFVGYTYINTYPYGEQPSKGRTPENNIWVQALISQKIGKIGLSHRYRLEQRWVGQLALSSHGYEVVDNIHKNRFRYRLTAKFRIPTDERFYFTVFDELWINYGKSTGISYFDQNWLFGGFGLYLNKGTAIELAYMWQFIEKPDGIRKESNNTIQLSLHYNIPIKK